MANFRENLGHGPFVRIWSNGYVERGTMLNGVVEGTIKFFLGGLEEKLDQNKLTIRDYLTTMLELINKRPSTTQSLTEE